ncbi:unnamed protein product [Paramecium sonneborni]|uniref:Uncharacterized protein n=1 Tax=Paramecium sonneborni TaxID=65129 RepID=A0A8S1R760_9CILI|nr:unnamed protein product [Paramecium sonneborni]
MRDVQRNRSHLPNLYSIKWSIQSYYLWSYCRKGCQKSFIEASNNLKTDQEWPDYHPDCVTTDMLFICCQLQFYDQLRFLLIKIRMHMGELIHPLRHHVLNRVKQVDQLMLTQLLQWKLIMLKLKSIMLGQRQVINAEIRNVRINLQLLTLINNVMILISHVQALKFVSGKDLIAN